MLSQQKMWGEDTCPEYRFSLSLCACEVNWIHLRWGVSYLLNIQKRDPADVRDSTCHVERKITKEINWMKMLMMENVLAHVTESFEGRSMNDSVQCSWKNLLTKKGAVGVEDELPCKRDPSVQCQNFKIFTGTEIFS